MKRMWRTRGRAELEAIKCQNLMTDPASAIKELLRNFWTLDQAQAAAYFRRWYFSATPSF